MFFDDIPFRISLLLLCDIGWRIVPSYTMIMLCFSIVLDKGDKLEAERLYRQAIQEFENSESFGPTHPQTLDLVHKLGMILLPSLPSSTIRCYRSVPYFAVNL
jgi:hypothetical protein